MPETNMPPMNGSNPQKLTEWVKEPTILQLKSDLEAAKPSHDAQASKIKEWNDLRNVEGNAKPKTIKGRSTIQPKLIRRQAEWRYSALSEPFLGSEKLYSVSPRTYEDDAGAKQNELVINWQFDSKINKVKFIDEYVRTTVDEGTGIVRVGWKRITETVMETVPVWEYLSIVNPEVLQMIQQAAELKTSNPKEYETFPPDLKASVDYSLEKGTPASARQVGENMVPVEKIIDNRPTVEMMHPDNVFIDPSCQGDYEKAGFIIISYETSKAELIEDGRYKNLDKVNWSGNTVLGTPDHASTTPSDFQLNEDLRKKVVAYEYWGYYDIRGDDRLRPIMATWIGDVLVRMEENPFPDEKPPFVYVTYLPVKREVMGEPDAEILEENQRILGAVTRGVIDLMGRSANAQQGFAKNFLDVTNRRRFDKGEDYEFNPGSDPRLMIFQHQYPEIPASAMNVIMMQNQEAEALSGVKSFAGGVSGEAYGDVAAGIKGVLDASSKREMNILRRLAKGIQDVGKKIMAMNALFMSDVEVIRVTNKEFVKVKREDLKGNFDLIVDIATAEVDDQRAQDLGFMLQTMGPNMDPEMSKMILAEIARLKRMPALAEAIARYQPKPDPILEEMKKMELEKLKAEVAKLQSDVMLNEAKAAEAQTQARVQQVEGANELSGLNHDRDLEKIQAQSRGNQDAEVTKALLKSRKPEETKPDVEAAVGYNQLSSLMR